MDDFNTLWDETKKQLSDSLPAGDNIYLSKISLQSIEDGTAVLAVPSNFVLDNVMRHKTAIESVISQKYGENLYVSFTVDSEIRPKASSEEKPAEISPKTVSASSSSIGRKNPTLNPKFTLDNFIQGDNTAIAYRAAEVIARNPGTSAFNPCLIYGGVGLGKTHLLQAIGNYIYDADPSLNVIYVTAEYFTNSFIEHLGQKNTNKFKKTYRNADVLLIDDIHFLQNKDSTQEELFHTFVELYHNNKQIVFTCDRPISELTDITERLSTRFSSGLNVDLQPPKYEVRVAIAKQKCKDNNLDIPDDVLDYICQNVNTNVRDLEGALKTVSGFAMLVGHKPTIQEAKESLKSIIKEPAIAITNYTISDVFTATANYFNVSLVDMKGTSRKSEILTPRQVAIYISYKYGHFTQSDIGKYINKDHTSIRYSVEKMESIITTNEALRKTIDTIYRMISEKVS